MSRIKWFVLLGALCWAGAAVAELPVQQSWRCQAGDVLVVSNTPCHDGAQAVTSTTTVIYHCQHNGVSSFQQRPCAAKDSRVHLYSDVRTPEAIASGKQVRSEVVASAKAARAAQLAREGGSGVTVVGTVASSNRTAGDGKADGYRKVNRSAKGGSGY